MTDINKLAHDGLKSSNFSGNTNILPWKSKSTQSRPKNRRLSNPVNRQLDLFGNAQVIPTASPPLQKPPEISPDTNLYIQPCTVKNGRYTAHCGFTGLRFGGSFTPAEIDLIVERFKPLSRQIGTETFFKIAESAIRQTQGFCYIPKLRSERWTDRGCA